MIDGNYVVNACRHEGMPALSVLAASHRHPGEFQGLLLAESPEGRPMGYVVTGRRDDLQVAEGGRADTLGIELVQKPGADVLMRRHLPSTHRGYAGFPAQAVEMGGRLSAWAGMAEFSDGFRELVELLGGDRVGPALLDMGEVHALCGPGATASAARRLLMAYPVLAYVRHGWLPFLTEGEAVPDASWFGYAPSVLRAVGTPPWWLGSRRDGADAWDPGRPATLAGNMCRGDWETLDAMLRELPPNWIPDEGPAIGAFLDAAKLLAARKAIGTDVRTLSACSKGDWPSFVARCRKASGGKGVPDVAGQAPYLSDPVRHLADKLALPLLALGRGEVGAPVAHGSLAEQATALAVTLVYGRKSLPAAYGAAHRWHARLPAIQRALPSDADLASTEWPALLPPGDVGCLHLRCLVTGRELYDEGRSGPDADGRAGLEHCVGSYRGSAMAGLCHVVSVREAGPAGGGARLATAEIRQRADGRLDVFQLKGRRNAPAPEGCAESLAAYLAGPVPYLPPRAPHPDKVRASCGYDWTDATLVAQAAEAYAPMLPRGARGGLGALAGWLGLPLPAGVSSGPAP